MKALTFLALLLVAPAFSGCASLNLRECGAATALGGAGGGALGAIFGADAVSGDTTTTRERVATGAAGILLGAVAGNIYCQQAIRQRRDLEERFARLEIELATQRAELEEQQTDPDQTASSAPSLPPAAPPPTAEVIEGRGVRLELGSTLLFDTGSGELAPHAGPYLDAVAQSLIENPTSQIAVVGHTDDTGDETTNMTLSERRARAVASYLTARGVAASRVRSLGKGESVPLIAATTPDARARNRRVEIYILPTA